MKYHSGEVIRLGDRVKYHGQGGCIALIGSETGSACCDLNRSEWAMQDSEVVILFDNGARLMLDQTAEDDLLRRAAPATQEVRGQKSEVKPSRYT